MKNKIMRMLFCRRGHKQTTGYDVSYCGRCHVVLFHHVTSSMIAAVVAAYPVQQQAYEAVTSLTD